MGIKITVGSVFMPHIREEYDIDDFVKIDVLIQGEVESNQFLLSLWHQFDITYAPKHSKNKVPWAYMPQKIVGKKKHILVLGNINTSIGNYIVAISYKRKGDIDSIYLYSPNQEKKYYNNKFQSLVELAKNHKNDISIFYYEAILISPFEGLSIQSYCGKNFKLSMKNDSIYVEFAVSAIDKYEAFSASMKRMNNLCAFLSVETNIRFEFSNPKISIDPILFEQQNINFQGDYIDFYPIADDRLMLSENGYNFINEYIFIERELIYDKSIQFFISACRHIYEGLSDELKLGDQVKFTFPQSTIEYSPRDNRDKQTYITKGVMSYLSAIETATMPNSVTITCSKCSSLQYKISSRITEFMTKYFHEDMGRIFKSLYSFRSQFLHAGKFATDNDYHYNRPLINISSYSGLIDYGFISIKTQGKVHQIYITNIREWTTYALRCYYQEMIYNRTLFDLSKDLNSASSYIQHYKDVIISNDIPGVEIKDLCIL